MHICTLLSAPAVQILDDNENVIAERHYKVDSSLHLTCRASNVEKPFEQLTWYKGDHVLPGNDSRIKVKYVKSCICNCIRPMIQLTQFFDRYSKNPMSGETNAFFSLHSVRKEDSGNYSCIASPQDKGMIIVHVLNGKVTKLEHYERLRSIKPFKITKAKAPLFNLLLIQKSIRKLFNMKIRPLGYSHVQKSWAGASFPYWLFITTWVEKLGAEAGEWMTPLGAVLCSTWVKN